MRKFILALSVMSCSICAESGEKVMFHDEITGLEMWRISDFEGFHEYPTTGKPFSEEGLWVVAQAFAGRAIAAFNMEDGRQVIIGKDNPGSKRQPVFVHHSGRSAVIYNCEVYDRETQKTEIRIYVYDLDTNEEKLVISLPMRYSTLFVGVIGPASDYAQLQGDLNGDGLSDWGIKSIWTDEPPRVVLSRPDADVFVFSQSPALSQPNRTALNMTILDPRIVQQAKSDADKSRRHRSHRPDSRFEAFLAELDMKTLKPTLYPARNANRWAHRTWTGDGKYIYMHKYAWELDRNKASVPIRIGELPSCDHYGSCGATGRYFVGDRLPNGMEEIWRLDLWTGEWRTLTHVSVTNNERGNQRDRAHAMGSPDGTKVLIRSCYERVNHRHFAVPTRNVNPGEAVIPVETTDGFPASGALMFGFPHRVKIAYERKDATNFYGCDWGEAPKALFDNAVATITRRYGPIPNIPKGSHFLTGALGRHFPNGTVRPPKGYIVVARPPHPPLALGATMTDGRAVRLTWQPPISHREVAGYVVYRRTGTQPLIRLTPEPLKPREYVDKTPPPGKATYLVRTVEHSGLYGAWSGLAWIDRGKPGAELLDSYDVRGLNFMAPGERIVADRRQVRVHVPVTGDYLLWGRGRASEKEEFIQVSVDGKLVDNARIEGDKWQWSKLGECRLTAGERVVELARDETLTVREGNLLTNPGFENGVKGWSGDESVMSVDPTRPHSGTQCLKFTGNLTGKNLTQKLALAMKPEWSYRMSFWVRGKFTKGHKRYPDTRRMGNIYFHVHGFPTGMKYTRHAAEFDDGEWHRFDSYLHTEPDSGKEPVGEVIVEPFRCHPGRGEQVGTLWLDDVEFVDLGPRLRPVKLTKLLVTNVPGYRPEGPDGRDAYPFPKASPVPVTGLRKTGQSPNSITLAWNAGRPGTRGYNVYLNRGDQCPATKYFLRTSVWGKTQVTLASLDMDAPYTVKVAAINEDGIVGPSASIHAITSDRPIVQIVLKPDQAALIGPMKLQKDGGRSFLVSPRKPEHKQPFMEKATAEEAGAARFEFVVKTPGRYAIWGLMRAPKRLNNALWFSLDGQPEQLWRLGLRKIGPWCWNAAPKKLWNLKAGKHTITARTCMPGTRLARIVVTTNLTDLSTQEPR